MSDLLTRISRDFIGLDTHYRNCQGVSTRRIYLDSAATCLALGAAEKGRAAFLRHYANVHSSAHHGAQLATKAYDWAHQKVLEFVGADPEEYTCVFVGSGATAASNLFARLMAQVRSGRGLVLASLMEHHANDLPHRQHVGEVRHIPMLGAGAHSKGLDLSALSQLLEQTGSTVNYVALTAASNVTGQINPIHRAAELAHAHGALILVDAAQALAHLPLCMNGAEREQDSIDAMIFSGHKAYVPGAPGVLVIRRSLLQSVAPQEVGGGMVKRVYKTSFILSDALPDRAEAGTPNIVGAVTLGMALETLAQIGLSAIVEHEQELLMHLMGGLKNIPGLRVYGDANPQLRVATVAFNIAGLSHGLVAAILNDEFNIAVRNECFCAHPYVRELLLPELWENDSADEAEIEDQLGMVRISLGLYNAIDDVYAVLTALNEIALHGAARAADYQHVGQGNYRHRSYRLPKAAGFDPATTIQGLLHPPKLATPAFSN